MKHKDKYYKLIVFRKKSVDCPDCDLNGKCNEIPNFDYGCSRHKVYKIIKKKTK